MNVKCSTISLCSGGEGGQVKLAMSTQASPKGPFDRFALELSWVVEYRRLPR